jgi:hypothetical protein
MLVNSSSWTNTYAPRETRMHMYDERWRQKRRITGFLVRVNVEFLRSLNSIDSDDTDDLTFIRRNLPLNATTDTERRYNWLS